MFSKTDHIIQYMFETPIDEFNVAKHLVSVRSVLIDPSHDESINEWNMYVANQDKWIVEDVDPMIYPASNTKEVFVPADAQLGAYREYLAEWEARGWRIDSKKVDEDKGRVGYAISSPSRREKGNWPLDTVPLIPATEAKKQAATG